MKKPAATPAGLNSKNNPGILMNTKQIIEAHARRLGLTPEQLTEVLLHYAASELRGWAEQQAEEAPESVWYSGDVPDWLEPHFLPALGEVVF